MATEKENFITRQYIPTGEPIVQNNHVIIYRVKCMAEPGQPIGILKMYKKKNVQPLYERLKQLDYNEWPHIYAVKYYDNSTLVVEEYLQGDTLAEILERNRRRGISFTEEEAKKIMDNICYAIGSMQKAIPPIYHSRLKPSNIFITKTGTVKFLDFEQDTTKQKNSVSSLFRTLGFLFHEILTGRKPSNGTCTYKGPYTSVICKCMNPTIEYSYSSIKELQKDLDEASVRPSQEEPKREKVTIPYTLTFPFHSVILAIEWMIAFCSHLYRNTATAGFFFMIFALHLILFILRRHQYLQQKEVYLTPLRSVYPFVVLAALLGLLSLSLFTLIP